MNEAFSRSYDILNPDDTSIVNIIGCGSIGSFVALCLHKMGFTKGVHLYDADHVGIENIGCQLFGWEHLGMPKVEALKSLLVELSPADSNSIFTHEERVTGDTVLARGITILGVDNMDTRKIVYRKNKNRVPLIIDGRIGGQVIRVFTVRGNDYNSQKYYEQYLYSDEEAEELPCTQRNVADVAFFTSAIIGRAARLYASSNTIIKEVGFDALTLMNYVTGDEQVELVAV
jgi:molybdopterin/thiamine biosynthesis adenylyltransferase